MEVDEPATAPAPREPLSVRFLQLVQTAQSQHGIRHNDHERYRKYCKSRLHKLYKATKLMHGRGKYVKKPIEPEMVTEERFLHIPLMAAERAWAGYQAAKAAAAAKSNAKLRNRVTCKLARAAHAAQQLATLAGPTCDAATRVEAEAYCAWMQALLLSEKGKDWDVALAKYSRARLLLESLERVGDYALQGACRQLLQQIEPAERFCSYQLERAGTPAPAAGQLAALGRSDGAPPLADLQASLKGVSNVGSGGTQAPPAAGESRVSASSIVWRGQEYPLYRNLVIDAALKVGAAQAHLDGCMDTDGQLEERERYQDELVAAYHRLSNTIAKELHAGATGDSAGVSADEVVNRLTAASVAVRGLLGEATIARALSRTQALESRWRKAQERSLLGGKGSKSKAKDKSVRAEDLAREYDALVALAGEMAELAEEVGGADAEHLMDESQAAAAQFAALRCYYIAATALNASRFADALVLFERALELADTATSKLQACATINQAAVSGIQQLVQSASALRCAAQAECCSQQAAEREGLGKKVKGMALDGASKGQEGDRPVRHSDKFMLANLDRWESFAGDDGREPRLFEVPPALEAVPMRPITLDSARDYLVTPSLDHRYTKKVAAPAATSTFARFFSWGSKKQ